MLLVGLSHRELERAVEGARRNAAELLSAGLVFRRAHLAGGAAGGVEVDLEAKLADSLGVVGQEHFAVERLGVDVLPTLPSSGGGGGGGGRGSCLARDGVGRRPGVRAPLVVHAAHAIVVAVIAAMVVEVLDARHVRERLVKEGLESRADTTRSKEDHVGAGNLRGDFDRAAGGEGDRGHYGLLMEDDAS